MAAISVDPNPVFPSLPEAFAWQPWMAVVPPPDPEADPAVHASENMEICDQDHPAGFRSFVGTLNNPSLREAQTITRLHGDGTFAWVVMGAEVAPTTGTPHLQLCITLPKPQRWNAIQNLLESNDLGRMWFKKALRVQAARQYCRKGGHVVELRHQSTQQGKRNDLDDLVRFTRDVLAGTRTFSEAFHDKYPDVSSSSLFRYSSHYERALRLCVVPQCRHTWTRGVWIHGPPGSGKTTWIMQAFPDCEFVTWTRSGFMNGYTGQSKVVVMDDEDIQILNVNLVKKLVNRTRVTVNVKNNGMMWWNPELLVIISNYEITSMPWYNEDSPEVDEHGYTAVQARFEEHRGGYTAQFTNFTVPHDCPDWLVGQGPAAGAQVEVT